MDYLVRDSWNSIKVGRFEEACARADVEYEARPSLLPLRNKVMAFLLMGRMDEVIELEARIFKESGGIIDGDFLFAGVARWYKSEFEAAIKTWEGARTCRYTDAGGGVVRPTLVYYGCLRTGDAEAARRAMRELERMRDRIRPHVWPGPVLSFILGDDPEPAFERYFNRNATVRTREECQAHFYRAVKHLQLNQPADAAVEFDRCAAFGPEVSFKPEYFLGRWEVANARGQRDGGE